MQEPIWVLDDVVKAIHRRQIAEHGGGSDGIRDANLLHLALGKAQNLYAYGDPAPDIIQLAAAYAHGIARNHPFIDGNKRTAFVVCRLFLKLNGYDMVASQEEKYQIFLSLGAGELLEEALNEWLKHHVVAKEPQP